MVHQIEFIGAHSLGECLTHDETRTCCLTIPRCATTAMKNTLPQYGFKYNPTGKWEKPSSWFTFAIWRDPLDRLVSGIVESARRRSYDPVELAQMVRDRTVPFVDEHLVTQEKFVPPWNPVDMWIPFDKLDIVLPLLLGLRGVEIKTIRHDNASDESIKQQIREVLFKEG